MKALYTTEEGGYFKTINVFAIFLPDGTIWDDIVGNDRINEMTPDEFNKLYEEVSQRENINTWKRRLYRLPSNHSPTPSWTSSYLSR